ncbi:BrnT family toxin [Reyranella sp.]|uniref:BrnT family toxin n=1 Tax=Reyranella sp. TaxID=1929291 RepID=UPI003D0E2A8C
MTSIRFEWDDAKNRSNQRKHGVSFEIAARVFADPFALTEQDRIEGGEMRWQTIGTVGGFTLLVVAHTIRDEDESKRPIEVIRIISARPAIRKERRRYEESEDR